MRVQRKIYLRQKRDSEKNICGRGRRRRRRRRGEQIKSCQMEILGFKRSKTVVRVCLFSVVFVLC